MRDRQIVWILLPLFLVLFSILNVLNEGSPGGGDTYQHYLISRWAFAHPEQFFNHWGKPIYTILSAPFAQFGYHFAVTFNILCSLFCGWLVYKSAEKLGVKNAWLGIIFTLFVPIFFFITFSTLTEIVFATLTMLSLYLFITKRYFSSIIVMSFIPFARTEGIIFFPLFLIALLALKKFKPLPFILVGFMVMAVIGAPFTGDIWWPITHMPYGDASGLYGSGSIFHFLKNSPTLFGWILMILYTIGGLVGLKSIVTNKVSHESAIWLLAIGISAGYFVAHSFVWAYGLGGSLGLLRVVAGVGPVIALVALLGWNWIWERLPSWSKIRMVIPMALSLVLVYKAYTSHKFPIPYAGEERVYDEARKYLQETGLENEYLVFYHPVLTFMLGVDIFSPERCRYAVHDLKDPSNYLKEGSIIVWDGHFGPNEGQLPRKVLDEDPDLELIKEFQPNPPFKVYGGQDFEVLVYQKKITRDTQ